MSLFKKIKNSWWVIFSFIIMFNGVGFLYIGFRHDNRNWIMEGITYELPWIFCFIFISIHGINSLPTQTVVVLAYLLMLVAIIRSIWVGVKLDDVCEHYEKYTIKQTNLNNSLNKSDNKSGLNCCFGLAGIFSIIALIIIL